MMEYPPPVDILLRIGETDLGPRWRDYRALGLGPEHVPDLIRMATDVDLIMSADLDDETAELYSWAPQHALRAIGQLGAVEAAGPLLDALEHVGEVHDFWVEDLSDVMARLGAGAIPACEAYLADESREETDRIIAAESLGKIGKAHEDLRDRCVAILTRRLERHLENPSTVNGFIISELIDLKAVESAPSIEAAFAADGVDEMIAGDWPSVRYDLGLGPKPESRRRMERRIAEMERLRHLPSRRPSLNKVKQQRKRQKAARKQQRKRKKR